MATQICPQCRTPAAAGERFCRQCGTTFATGDTPPGAGGYGQQPAGARVAAGPAMDSHGAGEQLAGSGFFAALFDVSFSQFITTRIIKVIYILSIIAIALVSLAFFVASATQGGGGAVVGLVLAPLFFLLYVIFARVYLEIIIVIFRIADYTREIAQQGRQQPPDR